LLGLGAGALPGFNCQGSLGDDGMTSCSFLRWIDNGNAAAARDHLVIGQQIIFGLFDKFRWCIHRPRVEPAVHTQVRALPCQYLDTGAGTQNAVTGIRHVWV
ncbi:MAG TPA: hypothetical protein VFB50_09985, partial [Chloroflexota bacterium]|nr:hypothetical protein [Chloroflexota bacterium]